MGNIFLVLAIHFALSPLYKEAKYSLKLYMIQNMAAENKMKYDEIFIVIKWGNVVECG